jgi:hypothetical protein
VPSTSPSALPSTARRVSSRTVAAHPEPDWSRLRNGVVVFDDLGELLPVRVPVGARAA